MNAHSRRCVLISISAIVFCGQAAFAQSQQQDEERMRREGVERADAAARAQGMEMERQRQERERQAEESRRSQSNSQSSPSTGGGYTPAPSGASSGRSSTNMRDERPKLPAERNVLLGSWRVESGSQGGGVTGLGQGKGTDRNAMARELLTAVTNPCVLMFGNGITFAPSTYSIQALDGGVFRGSVDYRSTQKQVISAVTEQSWKTLSFEIEGPNRVVWERFGCALVRVGAPAANAAANATTAPGNTRAGATGESAPRSSTALQTAGVAGVVVDGAAFRCPNGSHFFVSLCQGPSAEAMCKLSDPTASLDMGSMMSRAAIAAKVQGCEAGGIRYGADDKPFFVR